jgi:hypothetical protein
MSSTPRSILDAFETTPRLIPIKRPIKHYGTNLGIKEEQDSKNPKGNSWYLTGAIMYSNTIGAVGLETAVAVQALGGWLLGSVMLTGSVLVNMHMCIIVWRLAMCFPEQGTFVGVMEAAFGKAPRVQRYVMVFAAAFAQYTEIIVAVAFNLMTIGKSVGFLIPSWHVCLPVLMLIVAIALLPLQVMGRDFGSLSLLTFAYMILGSLVPIIPVFFFAMEGVNESRVGTGKFEALGSVTSGSLLKGMSSFTYALATQYLIVEFAGEMKDPEKLPQAYAVVTAPIQMLVLFVCGIGAYHFLGNNIAGSTFTEMPFGLALSLTSLCLIIAAVVTNHMNALPFCKMLHKFVDPLAEGSGSVRDWLVWSAVAAFTLFACWLVANLVPFFNDFVDLAGASVAPMVNYLIPIVAYIRCYWDYQGDERVRRRLSISPVEWMLIIAEFGIYSVVMIAGTNVSVHTIINNWATYGYPFQCNCEMMWDTCACSAKRPGMDICHVH